MSLSKPETDRSTSSNIREDEQTDLLKNPYYNKVLNADVVDLNNWNELISM